MTGLETVIAFACIAGLAATYLMAHLYPPFAHWRVSGAIRRVIDNALSDGLTKERAIQNALDHVERHHRAAMMTARLYRAAIRDIAATHYTARQQQAA